MRAENEELLDRISQIDRLDEEEDVATSPMKNEDLCSKHEEIRPTKLPDMDVGMCFVDTIGIDEDDSLLTVVQQYEDHEEYLLEMKDEEEPQDISEDIAADDEEEKQREKDEKRRSDLIASLVREGIEREKEFKKTGKHTSGSSKKNIWDFFTSRIDSALSWI